MYNNNELHYAGYVLVAKCECTARWCQDTKKDETYFSSTPPVKISFYSLTTANV